MVKDLPDYFNEIVVMNTGIPSGIDKYILFKEPTKTIQSFAPFLLWRTCVKLLENYLPIETMMKRGQFPI